jgi:hypothetical protein
VLMVLPVTADSFRILNQASDLIDELLQCNDTLCQYAVLIENAGSYLVAEKRIPLMKQLFVLLICIL